MKKQQRFAPDQRFDLPQYNSMMEFIAQEFHSYNKTFISNENKILKNWLVQDNGGLEIKLNKAVDSSLFNSERSGYEAFAIRETTCDDLVLELEDDSTNYVEVELFSDTTGADSVAIWDTTANDGEGEEFIQTVDTVTNRATHRLVSNTISFSTGQNQRIPLAIITTVAGAITNIDDQRDFLFHLENDWDFDGSSFGVTRTDKTIGSVKNDGDAIKTIIKEMKNLTPWTVDDQWYQPETITPMGLLERFNYILVDGGNISWDLPKPAFGSLIGHRADPLLGIKDGDTFEIDDGVNPAVTFEFDDDAGVSGGNTPVTINETDTAAAVKTAIMSAINGHAFDITASSGTGDRIELINDTDGLAGNVAITETLSNGATLSPTGMEGGFTDNQLQWAAALKIIAPNRAFYYQIDAQTISNVVDGEVLFVTLPAEGTAPAGSLTVNRVAAGSYLINPANVRNYIIAYRSAGRIYFGNGWQSVELEDGETNQLGDGITNEWMIATGLVDEYDSTPPYWSMHWISGSFTNAISQLDEVTENIWNMVAGPRYFESVVSSGNISGDKIQLPPPFGIGPNQNYQTAHNQLFVYIDGRLVKRGLTQDYIEDANVGAGIGNQIELRRPVNNLTRIDFVIGIGGGQDGTVASNAPDIYDELSLAVSQAGRMNFKGPAVSAVSAGPNVVDINITGAPPFAGASEVKDLNGTLDASDIQALSVTPITLLAGIGAGIVIIPVSLEFFFTPDVGVPLAGGNRIAVEYAGGLSIEGSLISSGIMQGTNVYRNFWFNTGNQYIVSGANDKINKDVQLSELAAYTGGGTCSLKWRMTYIELTVLT